MSEQIGRLREALGVGPKRAATIAKAWEEQQHIRQVMAAQQDLVEIIAQFDPKIVRMCDDGSRAED